MISHRGNLRAVFDLTQRLKCLCARRDSNVKNVFKAFLAAALLALLPLVLSAAESLPGSVVKAVEHGAKDAHAAAAHHGLPAAAPVFNLGPLQFTSSTVITWIVALGLIIFAQLATRNIQMVPSGLQNFAEWLVEGMYDFFTEILGKELVKKTFWFFCTLFIFILFTNWIGLIPGVGSITYDGKPILRGGNADLNMTLAISVDKLAAMNSGRCGRFRRSVPVESQSIFLAAATMARASWRFS